MATRKFEGKHQKAVIDEDQLPPLVELCANGDLTLLVGEDFGPASRFRVSRNTMCMASPVWRAMLSGPFSEANKDIDEITYADDNPVALLVILRIAHLKFASISRKTTLEELVDIATICDKYNTVAICSAVYPLLD
jgi:hypothetical protein